MRRISIVIGHDHVLGCMVDTRHTVLPAIPQGVGLQWSANLALLAALIFKDI